MNARITLIGIENELNALDKSITDTWECEYGDFDKDVLLSSIITTGATFEPIYTDPNYFYDMCGFWWKKWQSTINKWFDAFSKEYIQFPSNILHVKRNNTSSRGDSNGDENYYSISSKSVSNEKTPTFSERSVSYRNVKV
jgi:hypothetical protein